MDIQEIFKTCIFVKTFQSWNQHVSINIDIYPCKEFPVLLGYTSKLIIYM